MMTTLKTLLFCLFFLALPTLKAAETCSRIAIINSQEILIDTNSTQKGEGLRYYLEKDDKALKYLEKYQEGTGIRWENAAFGTFGTGLILTGVMTNSSSDNNKRLIVGGIGVLLINYLLAKTYENANEKNLLRAVEEYNKRNLPRIIFPVDRDRGDRDPSSQGPTVYLEKSWSF